MLEESSSDMKETLKNDTITKINDCTIEDTSYFGFFKRENCDKRKEGDAIYLYDDYKSFSKTQIVLIQVEN